jgi:hypothetical protein
LAVPHPAGIASTALVNRHKLIEFDARLEKIP